MKLSRFSICMAASLLVACGGGGGGSSQLIDPSDPNAVANALQVKIGDLTAEKREGDLPAQTNSGSEPIVSTASDSVNVSNGQSVGVDFQIDSGSALDALLIKVVGSDSFLEFDLGALSKASISETLEFTIPQNIADGSFCILMAARDRGLFVSAIEEVCFIIESTADDVPAPPAADAFTAQFLSDRAFYMVGVEGIADFLSEDGDGNFVQLFQYTFRSDGTATETWSPSEENSFSTRDTYEVVWRINAAGQLITEDLDEDGELFVFEITPSAIGSESATFSWTVTLFGPDGSNQGGLSGEGSMTAADASLYGFLAGRTFNVDVPVSDVEQWVFNPDGTGSVRFAPNPDNDFAQNDVNNLHWQAVSSDRVLYTEFGGDGYDREQTNCEDDPFIDCELNLYDVQLDLSARDANTAQLEFEIRFEGDVERGSGSMTAAAGSTVDDPVARLQGIWDFECDGSEEFNDSFKGSWEFSGNSIRLIEAGWSNASCAGDPVGASEEALTYSIGNQIGSGADGDTYEFSATNLTLGESFSATLTIGDNQLRLEPEDENSTANFFVSRSVSGVAFTNAFLSDRTFSFDASEETDGVARVQFDADGGGEIVFGSAIPISWIVASDGTFEFTEHPQTPQAVWTMYPIIVGADRAIAYYTEAEPDEPVEKGLLIMEVDATTR